MRQQQGSTILLGTTNNINHDTGDSDIKFLSD